MLVKENFIMINKVDNISFLGRFHFNGYSKHTPITKPYKEFYFMPELQKQNPIKKIFKNSGKMCNDLVCSIKSKLDVLCNNLESRINNLFYGNK